MPDTAQRTGYRRNRAAELPVARQAGAPSIGELPPIPVGRQQIGDMGRIRWPSALPRETPSGPGVGRQNRARLGRRTSPRPVARQRGPRRNGAHLRILSSVNDAWQADRRETLGCRVTSRSGGTADAAVSNTVEGNLVWVRIPPSAPQDNRPRFGRAEVAIRRRLTHCAARRLRSENGRAERRLRGPSSMFASVGDRSVRCRSATSAAWR
jgi:hypothetical protein